MRSFATIPPTIWKTDLKKLRGDLEAIAVYYHLTTSHHSTMIGIYPLNIEYLALDIGIPLEGASKGLQRVIDAGIASYDSEAELVWVHDMIRSQVAPRLTPKDNKVAGVAKQIALLPICPISLDFYRLYRTEFHLSGRPECEEYERALQGASEGLRSKEKDKEQDKGEDLDKESGEIRTEVSSLASTREDEMELPFDAPDNLSDGRDFLKKIGCPPAFFETALHRLMKECLFPCDIEEWKREARAA